MAAPLPSHDGSNTIKNYRRTFGVSKKLSTAENHRSVTAKQVLDAYSDRRAERRFVLDNSLLYTVRLCAQIIEIDQTETHTDFKLYDGTGTLEGRIWPKTNAGYTDLTGASLNAYYTVVANVITLNGSLLLQTLTARKIDNHNEVTMHFLSAIHQHMTLGQLNNNDLRKWEEAKAEAELYTKTELNIELDKEAVIIALSKQGVRESEKGGSTSYLQHECQFDENSLRETLRLMINEGSIYCVDGVNHYKLADNN